MSLAGAAACAEGAARSGAVAPAAHESTARKQTAAEPRILIV
jgi:hypothetical protein